MMKNIFFALLIVLTGTAACAQPGPGPVPNPWVQNGANIYITNSGGVGIGVTTPTGKLEVKGGCINLDGSSSGVISDCPQAAAGTYNFNRPTTAGNIGDMLTSGGGSTAPMLWNPPSNLFAPSSFRNQLVCGDASTCPNLRGNSFTGIAGTGTMTADYWEAIGGSSSNIDISVVGIAIPGIIAPTGMVGFQAIYSVNRANGNSNTAPIHFGQVLDSTDRAPYMAGKPFCLSVRATKASGFSSSGSILTAKIYSGSQSYEGYAKMVAGTWTNQTTIATLNMVLTTSYQSLYICSATPAPSNQFEMGVDFAYTPTGTSGGSDGYGITGIQLEPITIIAGQSPLPTPFEEHPINQELLDAQFRTYVWNEGNLGNFAPFSGIAVSSTLCQGGWPFSRAMRNPPVLTASTITAGTTWKALVNGAAANVSAIQLVTTDTSYLSAPVQVTTSGMSAGQPCTLLGNGGGATLIFDAGVNEE